MSRKLAKILLISLTCLLGCQKRDEPAAAPTTDSSADNANRAEILSSASFRSSIEAIEANAEKLSLKTKRLKDDSLEFVQQFPSTEQAWKSAEKLSDGELADLVEMLKSKTKWGFELKYQSMALPAELIHLRTSLLVAFASRRRDCNQPSATAASSNLKIASEDHDKFRSLCLQRIDSIQIADTKIESYASIDDLQKCNQFRAKSNENLVCLALTYLRIAFTDISETDFLENVDPKVEEVGKYYARISRLRSERSGKI